MSTAVPGPALQNRFPLRHSILRKARQRVVFGQDANDRRACSIAGDEGRWDPGHSGFDGEAGLFQLGLKQRGAFRFLVPYLGPFPDLPGDTRIRLLPGLNRGSYLILSILSRRHFGINSSQQNNHR